MSRTIITKELYEKIKKAAVKPSNDKKNMAKFGIGQTTIRYIRNAKNFSEYQEKSTGARKQRAMRADIDKGAYEEPDLGPKSINEYSAGRNPEAVEKRRRNIIDIIVLVAIALLIIGAFIFGGK